MRVMFAEAPARAARKCGAAVFGPPSHGKLLSSRQRPMHPGVFCHKNTHESYQGSARDASRRTTLHGWRAGLSHKKSLAPRGEAQSERPCNAPCAAEVRGNITRNRQNSAATAAQCRVGHRIVAHQARSLARCAQFVRRTRYMSVDSYLLVY